MDLSDQSDVEMEMIEDETSGKHKTEAQQKYMGVFDVHIENLIPPAQERTSRLLDPQHVEFLMDSFQSGISKQLTILLGMIPRRCDPTMLKTKGAVQVETLGGNHTREALQRLLGRGEIKLSVVKVNLYSLLSKDTALTIGWEHNVVLQEKNKPITFVDKVRLMRQVRPTIPLTPADMKAWKGRLSSIFQVKDMRRFQQSYGIHLQMAQLEQNIWDMVEESESAVKITEKFFRPLMKLEDDKIKICLEILKSQGLAEYNKKVKEFSPASLKKRKIEDACETEERNRYEDLLEKYNQMAENLRASQDRCSKLEKENSELRNKLAKVENSPMRLSSQPIPLNLELLVSVDLPETGDDEEELSLTGLDFLPDGRLVAVDNANMKCIILNERLERLGTPFKFKTYPQCVVCVSHDTLCVTFGGGKEVRLLSVSTDNTITLTKEIKTSSYFFSICCMSPSNMVVSTINDPRPVRMLSVDGVETDFDHSLTFPKKTYKTWESASTYVQYKNTLVLTDRYAHTVYMYDTVNGTSRAVTNEIIQEPCAACVGPGDTVLVCSMRKHSIVQLTIDGKILGTYPVDMKAPYSICVSKDGTRLAVSNCRHGINKLHLYKISPAKS